MTGQTPFLASIQCCGTATPVVNGVVDANDVDDDIVDNDNDADDQPVDPEGEVVDAPYLLLATGKALAVDKQLLVTHASFPTISALILACMNNLMPSEIIFSVKAFPTFIALEIPL